VLVRYSFDRNNLSWTEWVNCFSLGSRDRLELYWVHFADVIDVCYADIESRLFFLYSMRDWTGTEISINRQTFNSNLQKARRKKNINDYIITNKIAEEDFKNFSLNLTAVGEERYAQLKQFLEKYLA
jgi:hypothetical protein